MSQDLLPSKPQWDKWNLPSKHTTLGLLVGLVGIGLTLVFGLPPFIDWMQTKSVDSPPPQRPERQEGAQGPKLVLEFKTSSNVTVQITTTEIPRVQEKVTPEQIVVEENLFELSFDGSDDYCTATCAQFRTCGSFRIETSVCPSKYHRTEGFETLVALHNEKSRHLLALLIKPHEDNREHVRLVVLLRSASGEARTCLGPIIKRGIYSRVSLEVSESGLRVVSGNQAISDPTSPRFEGADHCTLACLQDQGQRVGFFFGSIQYLTVKDTTKNDFLAKWVLEGADTPARSVIIDRSRYATDLNLIGATMCYRQSSTPRSIPESPK